MPMTREKATESPWFLVKSENLLVREVSFRLLLLALLNGPRTDQHTTYTISKSKTTRPTKDTKDTYEEMLTTG